MSGSKSDSNTNSTSTQNGTTTNTYGNTTTSNPFFNSTTNNQGTNTTFANNGMQDVYNYINNNAATWLDEIKNPNINSAENQAKINAYNTQLAKQTEQSLNNDILAPLRQRNMLRSSVAQDMYNNLMNKNQESYANYLDSLIANSSSNAMNQFNTLANAYNGLYNMMAGNQAQSLQTSAGNAVKKSDSKTSTNSSSSVG